MPLTVAVIPTRYAPDKLLPLVEVLKGDGAYVLVLDNACDGACNEVARHALTVAALGQPIYRMWNSGAHLARGMVGQGEPLNVLVCNDDIEILPGTVPALEYALRLERRNIAVAYPDWYADWAPPPREPDVVLTRGTWAGGGMTGFCFMFKGELPLPRFDESFEWYFGDDAFESDVNAAGYGVASAIGVPIKHEYGTSARRHLPQIEAMIQRDMVRWTARKRGE